MSHLSGHYAQVGQHGAQVTQGSQSYSTHVGVKPPPIPAASLTGSFASTGMYCEAVQRSHGIQMTLAGVHNCGETHGLLLVSLLPWT